MSVKCTIAIPVWNREDFILRAMESALSQKLDGLEVVVVDNCSTDRTWDRINQVQDPRLRVFRNERNLGLFGNFNRCLEVAQGELVLFLCSDDVLLPGWLERAVQEMDRDPSIAMVTTRGRFVDRSGQTLGMNAELLPEGRYRRGQVAIDWLVTFLQRGITFFNFPSGNLLRSSAARAAGGYPTDFKIVGDSVLYLDMLAQNDLLVLDVEGCAITTHSGQAGNYLRPGITLVEDYRRMVGRYRALLEERRLYGRMLDCVAGAALCSSLQAARRRDWAKARHNWDFAREVSERPVRAVLIAAQLVCYFVFPSLSRGVSVSSAQIQGGFGRE